MSKRILALALTALLACPPLHGQAADLQLPSLGEETGALTLSEEKELGMEFMQEANAKLDIVDDPELNDYLSRMGYSLLAQMDTPFRNYRFFLIRDGNINAFAVPGGYIGVHTGLLLAAQNDSQLASVLAHELVHINQRHISRAMAQSERLQWPMLAAMLAGILLAAGGGQAGQAAMSASAAYGVQEQLRFSREYEQEADRLGIQAMAAAGYNPNGMPEFFQRLQNWSRIQGGSPMEFLSTHPLTLDRLADTKNRAAQLGGQDASGGPSPEFLRMQARARALTTSVDDAISYFRSRAKSQDSRQRELGQYGLGLALARKGQNAEALAQLTPLSKQAPTTNAYRLALAETLAGAGQSTEAVALYRQMLRDQPDSALIQEGLARALLEAKRSEEAVILARRLSSGAPQTPRYQQLLAEALNKSGQRADAHRALAEYYFLRGAVPSAVQQLEIAKTAAAGDPRLQAAIEARLAEIKAAQESRKKRTSKAK